MDAGAEGYLEGIIMLKQKYDDWVALLRAVGEAFFEVLKAEGDLVRRRIERSFRDLAIALALLFVTACLFFVFLGLVLFGLVHAIEHLTGLELWQAFGAVALGAAVVMALLASVAYFVFLRRFENPVVTARRRFDDHVTWWRESLLRDEAALPEGESHEPAGRPEPRENP